MIIIINTQEIGRYKKKEKKHDDEIARRRTMLVALRTTWPSNNSAMRYISTANVHN